MATVSEKNPTSVAARRRTKRRSMEKDFLRRNPQGMNLIERESARTKGQTRRESCSKENSVAEGRAMKVPTPKKSATLAERNNE